MIGVIVNHSLLESEIYVEGLLLQHCKRGSLKAVLRRDDTPRVSAERKGKENGPPKLRMAFWNCMRPAWCTET